MINVSSDRRIFVYNELVRNSLQFKEIILMFSLFYRTGVSPFGGGCYHSDGCRILIERNGDTSYEETY